MKSSLFLVLLPAIGLALILRQADLQHMYDTNRFALHTTRAILGQSASAQEDDPNPPLANTADNCRVKWLRGHIEDRNGNVSQRNLLWKSALRCESLVADFLSVLLPEERSLAQIAVSVHAGNAQSWFWLADARTEGDVRTDVIDSRESIIAMYRVGLRIAPFDGLRWRKLGDLLVPIDREAAIDAYLKSCFLGDPGSNGCWRAGGTAEKLGDMQNAIRYYRYSQWEGALNRAAELEAQLRE